MHECRHPPFLPIPTEPLIALITTGLLNPSISRYYNIGLPIKWNILIPVALKAQLY